MQRMAMTPMPAGHTWAIATDAVPAHSDSKGRKYCVTGLHQTQYLVTYQFERLCGRTADEVLVQSAHSLVTRETSGSFLLARLLLVRGIRYRTDYSELGRRCSELLPEGVIKIGYVIEAAGIGNFGDTLIGQ